MHKNNVIPKTHRELRVLGHLPFRQMSATTVPGSTGRRAVVPCFSAKRLVHTVLCLLGSVRESSACHQVSRIPLVGPFQESGRPTVRVARAISSATKKFGTQDSQAVATYAASNGTPPIRNRGI